MCGNVLKIIGNLWKCMEMCENTLGIVWKCTEMYKNVWK